MEHTWWKWLYMKSSFYCTRLNEHALLKQCMGGTPLSGPPLCFSAEPEAIGVTLASKMGLSQQGEVIHLPLIAGTELDIKPGSCTVTAQNLSRQALWALMPCQCALCLAALGQAKVSLSTLIVLLRNRTFFPSLRNPVYNMWIWMFMLFCQFECMYNMNAPVQPKLARKFTCNGTSDAKTNVFRVLNPFSSKQYVYLSCILHY